MAELQAEVKVDDEVDEIYYTVNTCDDKLGPIDPTTWRDCSYWGSYLTMLSISFAGFVDYSVIMPSAQKYCELLNEGDTFYGIALAMYPFARLFILPAAGHLADQRSMRIALLGSVAMQLIGCALYGSAQAIGQSYIILLGRLVAGAGSTNNAMVQKFVIVTTSTEGRSKAIAILQAVNLVGIALGPATNFILANMDFHIVGKLEFTQYTGAGFFLMVYHFINMCLALVFFKEPPPGRGSASAASSNLCHNFTDAWKRILAIKGAPNVMLIACLAMLWLSLLEALVSPIAQASFGWTLQSISVFFAVFAVVAAVIVVIVGIASKCFSDRSLIALSLPFYVSAVIVFWLEIRAKESVPLWAFLLAGSLITMGFTCQNAPSVSLFTKFLTATSVEGFASSILLQAQGAGRVLGPFIAGFLLDHGGLQVCAYVLAVLVVLQLLLLFASWQAWHPQDTQDYHTPFCSPQPSEANSPNVSFLAEPVPA